MGPVLLWSQIVWRAVTGTATTGFNLPNLRQMAEKVLTRPPTAWSSCRGPMGAAYLSLKRIQWAFLSPFVI